MTFEVGGAQHGAYLPEDLRWTTVDGKAGESYGDHHRVWLRQQVRPGCKYRQWVLIGELRRHSRGATSKEFRYAWRAFPAGSAAEFPEVFPTHYLAMDYLKKRWISQVVLEVPRPSRKKERVPASPSPDEEKPPVWADFFGGDLWDDIG